MSLCSTKRCMSSDVTSISLCTLPSLLSSSSPLPCCARMSGCSFAVAEAAFLPFCPCRTSLPLWLAGARAS